MFNIVIGVTGHRDIYSTDNDSIIRAFEQLIEPLLNKYENLTIRVMTGLAEGADSLIASHVLSLIQQNKPLQLVSVLPMPIADYRNDFSGDALSQFEKIISKATLLNQPIVELSLQNERNHCYQALGQYLINKSDLLVSIWNGAFSQSVGGTSDVTHRFLTPLIYPENKASTPDSAHVINSTLNNLDVKAVYHIFAARKSEQTNKVISHSRYLTSDDGFQMNSARQLPEQMSSYFKKMDELAESASVADSNPYPIIQDDTGLPSDLKSLNHTFSKVDAVANKLQKKVMNAHLLAALFSIIIGGSLTLFKSSNDLVLLVFYTLTIVLAFAWYMLASPNNVKALYAFYRTLAESLRIEYFLNAIGLVDEQGNHSLAATWQGHGHIEEQAILSVIRQSTFSAGKNKVSAVSKSALVKQWIVDQMNYYQKASAKLLKKQKKLSLAIQVAVYIPVILVAVMFGFEKFTLIEALYSSYLIAKPYMVLMAAFLPILAAVLAMYEHNQSYNELISQYNASGTYLSLVQRALSKAQNDAQAKDIFFAAGQHLSQEHSNWMSLIIQKKITPQTSTVAKFK